MKQNNLYLKYNPGAEIIAIPFIVSRIIKGKNIKELLYDIINAIREKAANVKLNELEKFEAQIEYNNIENFFATHFKALENSNEHTFEDKIKYCLKKYAKESKSLLSAANTVVLEENFLKGAQETLFYYFIINENKKPKKTFQSIFANKENYNKFISIMKNNSYLNENNKIDIPIIFFAGILTFLKKNGIIKKVKSIDIVKFLKDDFNFEISPSSFSSATPYPTKDEEKKLFDDLSKEFMIKY